MSPRLRSLLAHANAWRQQPTTIGGLSALAAAGSAWSEGNHPMALWLAMGGLVACLMPDNTRVHGPMTRLLVDVVSACALHQVATSLPKLAADAIAIANADAAPVPTEPTEPTTETPA